MGSNTALVLLLPGLGDALAASPILRGLSRAYWTFDVMTWQAPVSEYVRGLGVVRNVVELPLRPSAAELLQAIFNLRSRRYDVSILPFPATRWQYTIVARAAGAKKLWMHEYGGTSSAIARTARNARIPLRGGHRLAENLRLARALGFQSRDDDLTYWLPQSWRAPRLPGTLGVHPGSMAYKGNESKRWPYDRFVALARSQAAEGRSVRFFWGRTKRMKRVLPNETSAAPAGSASFANRLRKRRASSRNARSSSATMRASPISPPASVLKRSPSTV